MLHRLKEIMSRNMDKEFDEVSGTINRNEMRKLKISGLKAPSPHRKSTVDKWDCMECRGSFYYRILRCPVCESARIKQIVAPTLYNPLVQI